MAFKVRCEFWELATPGDIGTVVMKKTVAAAQEITAETSPVVVLPVLNTKKSYGMCVIGLSGSAIVEVRKNPTGQQSRGHLIREGDSEWFVIDDEDKLYVDEYTE